LHAIDGTLYSGKTKFQLIEILQSPAFGKLLVLDGKIQSSEVDEFIYHELLVHPPMLAHPILKRFHCRRRRRRYIARSSLSLLGEKGCHG